MKKKLMPLFLLLIILQIHMFGLVFADDLSAKNQSLALNYSKVFFKADESCGIHFSLPDNADAVIIDYTEKSKSGEVMSSESLSFGKNDFSRYYDADVGYYQYLTHTTYEDYFKKGTGSISFEILVYDSYQKIIADQTVIFEGMGQFFEYTFNTYAGETRSEDLFIEFQETKLGKVVLPEGLKGANLSQEGIVLQKGDSIQKSNTDYSNPHFVYFSDLPKDLKVGDVYDIYMYLDVDNSVHTILIHLNVIEKMQPTSPPHPSSSVPDRPALVEKASNVIINGLSMPAAFSSHLNNNVGNDLTRIKLDTESVMEQVNKDNLAEINIEFTNHSSYCQSEMNLALIDDFTTKDGQFSMQTDASDYLLPMSALSMEDLMTDIPDYAGLEDVSVFVEIKKPDKDIEQKIDNHFNLPGESEDKYKETSLDKKELLVNPVSYKVYSVYNGKAKEIDLFKQFVTRLIPLEKDMDENKMTTAIVIRPNGTYYSVPSKVIEKEGKAFLEIKSLSNSTYSAIENKVTTTDMTGHWAKEATESLASKMILDIQPDGAFYPNAPTSSNTFSLALMKTMGIDVSENWQALFDQMSIGSKSLLNQDTLTREEAMVLLANAIEKTGDYKALSGEEVEGTLEAYKDYKTIDPAYQKAVATCIDYQLIAGDSSQKLMPKGQVTNGQMAVMLDKLLLELQ